MKEHAVHQKHTELKQKMRELNNGFERLRKISHEGFSEDSGERRVLLDAIQFTVLPQSLWYISQIRLKILKTFCLTSLLSGRLSS